MRHLRVFGYHVTRQRNQELWGHEACHCDAGGCAGDELYLGVVDDVVAVDEGEGDELINQIVWLKDNEVSS